MTALKALVVVLALANVIYFLWEKGFAQPAPVAASAAAPSLTLASESAVIKPETNTVAAVAPEAHDGNPGELLTSVKRCISVGPFRDVSEAARAASTLKSGGYDPRQRVAEGEVWAGVWVYLPRPSSKAAADAIFDKLKSGGIEDALEMPGPNDTSVISLGLFSEPKRAQARVAQVQAMQLNPAIADRKRSGNVYWIDIDLKPTDGLLNPSDLQGDAGHIVRLEVKGCPVSNQK